MSSFDERLYLYSVIPWGSQAIVASYRFNCSRNITQWEVALNFSRLLERTNLTIELQVWRQAAQTVNSATQCYRKVGGNTFTIKAVSQVATLTPREEIEFLPRDVVGFRLSNLSVEDSGEGKEQDNRNKRQDRSNFNGNRGDDDDDDDDETSDFNGNRDDDDDDDDDETSDFNGNRDDDDDDDDDETSDFNGNRDDDDDDDDDETSDFNDNRDDDDETSDDNKSSDIDNSSSDDKPRRRDGLVIAIVAIADGTLPRENVWYAPIVDKLGDNSDCPISTGRSGVLNTLTRGAPVMSVSALMVDRPATISLTTDSSRSVTIDERGTGRLILIGATTASAIIIIVGITLVALVLTCLLKKRRAKINNLAGTTTLNDHHKPGEDGGEFALGSAGATQNGRVSQASRAAFAPTPLLPVTNQQRIKNKLELSTRRPPIVYKTNETRVHKARVEQNNHVITMKANEAYGKMANIAEINDYDYPSFADYNYAYPS